MSEFNIEAIYEHGTLKLPTALPLQDGQRVSITIHPVGSAVDRLVGSVSWHGSVEELDRLIDCEDNSVLEAS